MKTALVLVPVAISVVLYVASLLGLALGLGRGRRRARGRLEPTPNRLPRVSILKPLAGHDDELAANLASFAAIEYPSYEVLLGVASPTDPALVAANTFVRDHPWVDARIVFTRPDAALNPKVAQLIGLDAVATGEIAVISDSNVRVPPRYLSSLVAELLEPGVGLVSSLVAGTGERTLGAAVENLNMGASFAPLVTSADLYVGKALCIGKSMAMWRRVLARLGGFERVGNVLGEDHVLGLLFDAAGFTVRLSVEPVENRNVDCSLSRTFERHSRWSKMRRWIAPVAFLLEPLALPVLVATVAALAFPSALAVGVLLAAMVLQVAGAFWALRALRGRTPAWHLAPLEVLRSYFLFACWCSAWVSSRISWRGHSYRLRKGSILIPTRPTVRERLRAVLALGVRV